MKSGFPKGNPLFFCRMVSGEYRCELCQFNDWRYSHGKGGLACGWFWGLREFHPWGFTSFLFGGIGQVGPSGIDLLFWPIFALPFSNYVTCSAQWAF
jgi:hypothetical protein